MPVGVRVGVRAGVAPSAAAADVLNIPSGVAIRPADCSACAVGSSGDTVTGACGPVRGRAHCAESEREPTSTPPSVDSRVRAIGT
eukprot:1997205-Pleurochrysis_carterae.AAC.2